MIYFILDGIKLGICRYLDEKGVETPLAYKERTTNYKNPLSSKCTYKWSVATITKILKNKDFIGLFVQNKTKKVNYKVDKTVRLNEEFNIVVENKELAYVDANVFKVVSEKLQNQSNKWDYTANAKPHLLRGLVFCSCGAKVGYNKNHGKHFRCLCMKHKRTGEKFHSNIHLLEDEVIKEVVTCLREKLQDILKSSEINYEMEYKPSKIITDNSKYIKKKLEEIDRHLKEAFEDKANRIITQEMFISISGQYAKEQETLKSQLRVLELNNDKEVKEESICSILEIERTVKDLMELKDEKEVSRSIIEKFIERIVLDDREIDIKYKFRKE